MPEPVPFKESNLELLAPRGMSDRCLTLPVFVCPGGHPDAPFMISRWRLTKPEIEKITETGDIWLWIHCNVHPPVSISTEYPFL
jgi:hypothetical protein